MVSLTGVTRSTELAIGHWQKGTPELYPGQTQTDTAAPRVETIKFSSDSIQSCKDVVSREWVFLGNRPPSEVLQHVFNRSIEVFR